MAAAGLSKSDMAELRKLEAEALARIQAAPETELLTSLTSPQGGGQGGMSKYQQLLAVIEEMGGQKQYIRNLEHFSRIFYLLYLSF